MIGSVIVLICVTGLLLQQSSAAVSRVSLRQKPTGERSFVDEFGRELYFHGVNAIVKGPPWIPETRVWDGDTSLTDKDFDDLELLGMNIIRLGSMWPGVEPEEGQYSQDYIDKLRLIMQGASERNIYTVLDMHQDVMSERFCGEGVPSWVIDKSGIGTTTFPAPMFDNTTYTDTSTIDGFPTRSDCSKSDWPSYYSTYDTSGAFDGLYTNSSGLLDNWGAFWAKLAAELKGQAGLMGYELINEPWAGDIFETPKLLVPSVADKERLQPAYDALAAAIRAQDSEGLIFFAAVTWDDPIPAGFSAPPGGAEEAERSVFAYHYYEPPQAVDETYFHTRTKDAQRLQVASMVTEFERPNNNDDFETDSFFDTAAVMDQYLQSWIMWELKTFCKETDESLNSDSQNAAFGSCKTGYGSTDWLWDAEGNINPNTSKKLARSYAQAVAGNVTHMRFDHTSAEFRLSYAIDTGCTQPTVIFAHKDLQYPAGYQVRTEPRGLVECVEVPGKNLIEVRHTAAASFGQSVEIHITPATAN